MSRLVSSRFASHYSETVLESGIAVVRGVQMPSGFGGTAQASFSVALMFADESMADSPIADVDKRWNPLGCRRRSRPARASVSFGATALNSIVSPLRRTSRTATSDPSNALSGEGGNGGNGDIHNLEKSTRT